MVKDVAWYRLVSALIILVLVGLLLSQLVVGNDWFTTTAAPLFSFQNDAILRTVADVPVFSGGQIKTNSITLPAAEPQSLVTVQDQLARQLTAQSVVAVDVDSAAVLFEKNAQLPVHPASTVKLMTALVARDSYQLEDKVTVLEEVNVEGNTAGLKLGEVLSIHNTLRALLIGSGNDAALVLAYSYPQGPKKFIDAMNSKSIELGLSRTLYENATGLDQYEQVTTARDLAIVAREVLTDPVLAEIVATQNTVISDEKQLYKHYLANTNALLGVVPGVRGMKTGTTPLAKEALVTVIERDGHRVVLVVLGSQDRYSDTKQLISWIFEGYVWYPFGSQELKALLD